LRHVAGRKLVRAGSICHHRVWKELCMFVPTCMYGSHGE
jgi:hypothetical protein